MSGYGAGRTRGTTGGLAIASLVLGIVGLFFFSILLGLLALVFGYIALRGTGLIERAVDVLAEQGLAARPVGVRVAWVTLVGLFNKPLACREIINGREEAA